MADSKSPSALSITLNSYLLPRFSDSRRLVIYQAGTFFLTFVTYLLYHANRKVVGIVKQVWNENCTEVFPDINNNISNWCDWPPFDGDNANSLFGYMDASFLIVYAISMFGSGYLAERNNLRKYLSLGMFFAGFFNLAVGAGYWLQIHSFAYYLIMNMLAGMFQATGWPAVVALMGNWFGRSKRGFIFGTWNIHTSVGNMFGSFVAGVFVTRDWGLSFAVPAMCMMYFAIMVVFLAVPHPKDVGIEDPNKSAESPYNTLQDELAPTTVSFSDHQSISFRRPASVEDASSLDAAVSVGEGGLSSGSYRSSDYGINGVTMTTATLSSPPAPIGNGGAANDDTLNDSKAINFFTAVLIPGVTTYAIALFFIKFVNYVFMFWLPKYINTSTSFNATASANMSMFFDLGGIMGGMTAGALSDKFKKPANTCFWMLVASIPMLYIYYSYGAASMSMSAGLLVATGFFVNAPYALITTAVSAELGQHESLQGNAQALATVSAVIDGTGSLGAALGPLLTGIVSDHLGWESVFYMLMIASGISLLCLLRLVIQELRRTRCCCSSVSASV